MKTKLCTTFLCSLRVSSRNLCRELYVCVCVCVQLSLLLTLFPPFLTTLPFHCPRCFCILHAHLLHFLQLKSKLSSIRSICRLGRDTAPLHTLPRFQSCPTPLALAKHPLPAPLDALWQSSCLVTHTSYGTFPCCFSHFQFKIAAAAAAIPSRPASDLSTQKRQHPIECVVFELQLNIRQIIHNFFVYNRVFVAFHSLHPLPIVSA